MQKKKLLLLSAIVLLMGTNSYGQTFEPIAGSNEEQIVSENITVTSGSGHQLNPGKADQVTTVRNTGKIIVNGGVGVNLYYDSNSNWRKGKTHFINAGEISVNGLGNKGIQIGIKGKTENNGRIEARKGGVGVVVNASDSIFVNNENGKIIVNGESVKNSENKEVATTGILVTNGSKNVENNGYIEVNQISGEGAVGIQVNDGKATNNEDILVNAGKYTSGMKAAGKNALAENNGNLTINGDKKNTSNGMLAQNGGKVVNGKDGVVKASGKTTSAMSASGKGSKAENIGKTELFDNAIGMKIEKEGIGTNSGTIKGSGTGINLIGGIFVNSGEISTGDIAIQSSTTSKKENNQTVIVPTNNTVYLKNGSKVNGKIVGNIGVDVLALEGKGGEYSNLDVSKYEAITVRNGDATISDSTIALEYNKGTKDYLNTSNNELDKLENSSTAKIDSTGNLTMKNSNLIIDFKDSLTNPNATENPIIDTGSLSFEGKTSFVFNSSDGRTEFNLNEALGLEGKDKINLKEAKLETTAVWDYQVDENGDLIAKKETYDNVITDSRLDNFAKVFEKNRSKMSGEFFKQVVGELDTLKTEEEFTKAMGQISGGIHGYTVDIAAINSRNLVNTMKNKALTRDYLTARPLNSWYQDVIYLDNNQRLGGLMSGSYQENGILGISEKQSVKNGRLGFVYGGSKGKAKFDGGDSGEIATDNIYVGLYYNHNLSEKLALNTNFSFVYGHNNINRRVNIGNFNEELKSHYPTYAMGVGTSAIYTIKDDAKNKASFYAGIDVNRIMQGNINEKEEERIHSTNQDNINLMVKNQNANEFSYYSITPHAGFMFQNTGYIFDRKYLVGADLAWETELGNIKDGKRLNMQGITDQYKVGTMERENVFSTSIFGQLDITESLALNGRYTSSISDEYDADMLTMGLTYKMDTMADTPIFGPLLSGIENTRLSSDRWSGTFALMMESEDDSDRVYYSQIDNSLSSGDYATSMKMKPKFTLSLNDKKTKW